MNRITSLQLTAEEQRWSPDEWAWQFLRRNERYKNAFSIAAAKHSLRPREKSTIADHLSLPDDPHIIVSDREICAREFGLAAFVHPDRNSLPPLTKKGSWFHPLLSPVHAHYLDRAISPQHPRADKWLPLRRSRFLMSLETPFGYDLQESRQPELMHMRKADVEWITDEDGRRKRKLHYRPIPRHAFLISAAVDCSVPPDGQMSAFAQWAKAIRKDLQLSLRVTSHDQLWRVDPVDVWVAFSGVDLRPAKRTGIEAHGAGSSWRVVSVDVLGSLTTQIRNCEKALRAIYRQRAIGWIDKFPRFIPGVVDSRTASAARPSYMKLLIKLAHDKGLASWDGDDDSVVVSKIAEGVGLNTGHNGLDFELGPHLRKVQELITGDYRMLIHGQVNALPKP